jgi:hypothetical protein
VRQPELLPISSAPTIASSDLWWTAGTIFALWIYGALIEAQLDAPKHLGVACARMVLCPKHEDFQPCAVWGLSNVFNRVVLRNLDLIPQFKARAKLGPYLEPVSVS